MKFLAGQRVKLKAGAAFGNLLNTDKVICRVNWHDQESDEVGLTCIDPPECRGAQDIVQANSLEKLEGDLSAWVLELDEKQLQAELASVRQRRQPSVKKTTPKGKKRQLAAAVSNLSQEQVAKMKAALEKMQKEKKDA